MFPPGVFVAIFMPMQVLFFTRVGSTISIWPVVYTNPFQTSVFRGFLLFEKVFVEWKYMDADAQEVVKNEPLDKNCPVKIVPKDYCLSLSLRVLRLIPRIFAARVLLLSTLARIC